MANGKSTTFNYGSEQLIRDGGSVSFLNPLGTSDDVDKVAVKAIMDDDGTVTTYVDGDAFKIKRTPGILCLDYYIVPGVSEDGTSTLNLASKKLYTFVRHANSGSRNYDSPDLINFAFAGVSLNVFIANCQRAYKAMLKYSGKNRYIGKQIVEALGFDYENLVANLADFRLAINVAVTKLNAIKIPSAWPFWDKNWLMNSCLLKDGEIDRSQIYAFRSCVIWKYNETGDYVGNLTPVLPFGNNGLTKITLSSFNSIVDSIVNAFVASEDINIMSGDIMKAYGEDKCLELPYLDEATTIEPIYDRSLLEIMHNATPYEIGTTYGADFGFTIWQNTADNSLRFIPIIAASNILEANQTYSAGKDADLTVEIKYTPTYEYLDLFRDDVTPTDVIQSSIFLNIPSKTVTHSGVTYHTFSSCGTELATRFRLCYFDNSAVLQTVTGYRVMLNDVLSTKGNYAKWITLLSKFDWHPRYSIVNYFPKFTAGIPDDFVSVAAEYDVYNYAVVSDVDVNKMHLVHVIGGFGLE